MSENVWAQSKVAVIISLHCHKNCSFVSLKTVSHVVSLSRWRVLQNSLNTISLLCCIVIIPVHT